jgi:hypothetical protein
MTTDLFNVHHELLARKLELLGLSAEATLSLGERVRHFDAGIAAARWVSSERSFLITKGCVRYPGGGNQWRDEFLVEESESKSFSFTLLVFSVYYHLTLRPLMPSDVIEIGDLKDNAFGYSHVFVSVPFFFPGHVNVISIGGTNFSLQWLMPIYPQEAAFIEKYGPDKFEERLRASPYDYFDIRSDFRYLDD